MARAIPGLTLRVPPVPADDAPVLRDVTVIEPGEAREPHQTIAARDGRIVRTGEGGDGVARGAASAPEAGLAGAVVLPGLIDMHTHLPPDNVLGLVPYFQLLSIAHGVTATRDAGDADGTSIPAAQSVIAAGAPPAPRLFACGPFVGGTPTRWPNTLVVAGPDDAERAARLVAEQGFQWVKSYDGLSRAAVHRLIAAASEQGLQVMGHVPTELAFEDARIPDTQHFFGVPRPEELARDTILERNAAWEMVDERRMEEVVELSLERDIAHTPTLVVNDGLLRLRDYAAARSGADADWLPRLYADAVWNPQQGNQLYRGVEPAYLERLGRAFEKKRELVGRLHRAGARLHLGTDTQQPFSVPGVALHRELRLFASCGARPETALRLATAVAGAALADDGLGTLRHGAPADMLVFAADPTEDLAGLDSLQAVVSRGRLYRVEDLQAAVASCRRQFARWPFDRLSVSLARRAMSKPLSRP